MARRRLRSLIDITRANGCEPGEYLAGRLLHYVNTGDHAKAEELAGHLIPYTRPKTKMVELTGSEGGGLNFSFTIGGPGMRVNDGESDDDD